VVVEQEVADGWKQIGEFDANDYGIFAGDVLLQGDGALRARLDDGSAYAYPFSLQKAPDGTYRPFGS
jgi:hypothetical protein